MEPTDPTILTAPNPAMLGPDAKKPTIGNRVRWAVAFLGSAVVLGGGLLFWGDFELFGLAPVGIVIRILALLFAVIGLVAGVGALTAAFRANGKRTALVLGIGLAAVVVFVAGVMVLPFIGALAVPAVLGLFLVAAIGTGETAGSPSFPGWRRGLLALPFALTTIAIVVVGVLHIFVWNPLARIPGLSLDEIYGAMAAANETAVDAQALGWAFFWGVAALAFVVLASIPRMYPVLTARRIVVVGFLLVGVTASLHWLAGFSMGMSLADTFMTSGGDAAVSGPLIALIGLAAMVAALFIGLVPRLVAVEVVDSSPPQPAV